MIVGVFFLLFGISILLRVFFGWHIPIFRTFAALFLIYLGVRAIMTPSARIAPLQHLACISGSLAFRRGVLTNVLNPKVALFFLALLPQFIDSDSPNKIGAFLALGLTFVATGTAWCLFLAVAASHIRGYFVENPAALGHISRASGALFVLLGLRLATSGR